MQTLVVEYGEKIMAVLSRFGSSGGSWVTENIIRLDIKFARYRPVRGLSHCVTPYVPKLSTILNIRHHDDAN